MATVNELRDALRDERARVADLRKRVQDNKYLRGCLTSASGVLLHRGTRHQPSDHGRTPGLVLSGMVAPADCGPDRWREGTGQFR
jgi:hypothetical protein